MKTKKKKKKKPKNEFLYNFLASHGIICDKIYVTHLRVGSFLFKPYPHLVRISPVTSSGKLEDITRADIKSIGIFLEMK